MHGVRKVKQAWIFCRVTKRGWKNYRKRVAYRAKVIRVRDRAEVQGLDK